MSAPRAVARMGFVAVLVAVTAGSLAAQPATPTEPSDAAVAPEARAHLDRGLAEYDARRYAAAAVEFQAAYAIDPRREILFVWAQAARLSGDCRTARLLYEKFLALDPPADEADKARARMAECRQPPPELAPVAVVVARPPWYRDALGASLIAGGVVVGGVGAALIVTARGEIAAPDHAAFDRELDAARRRHWFGVGGAILGGGLLIGGVVRLAVADRARERPIAVAVGPSGISLAGSF